MASEVYVLKRIKYREAWWLLTGEEQKSLVEKIRKSRKGIAVKRLALFAVELSENIVVNVWPDMESYHQNSITMGPQGLNIGRYWDMDVTLGSELLPPWGAGPDIYARQDDLPLV